ncbi:MAG: hypothetical protein FJY73_07460 [Candidatus Eisenbacteria bacterium]|nr:hypothetical protein [Candidatus Eisenbacteria bacterium]
MKYIVLALLFVASFASADNALTPTNVFDGVKESVPGQNPFNLRQGGETIALATVIPGLPYTDVGTTSGYIDNYNEVCPYTLTGGRDVVYKFTPTTTMQITIDLCDSYYDTKVYVYRNSHTPGAPWACNDDACSGPNYPYAYLSYLECVQVYAGDTYYIVVDGYSSSDYGTYVLKVRQCVPCETPCPPGGIAEGEPTCYPGYQDPYNGGCNSTPNVFQTVLCPSNPVVYCGETGNWLDYYYYRDTDWYEIVIPGPDPKFVTATVEAEFGVLMFLIAAGPEPTPCTNYSILTNGTANKCVPLSLSWNFNPGKYWIWVGPSSFYAGIPCSGPMNRYTLEIDGYCDVTAIENSSWGNVKTLFR